MSAFWRRLHRFFTARPPAPPAPPPPRAPVPPAAAPPPAATAGAAVGSLPRTFRPSAPDDGPRPRLFDPALRQFPSAFRAGDPTFTDADAARRWVELRRRVTDHVLRRIAESPAGDSLVLRGSRMLRAWFGDAAREPRDLDWVADAPAEAASDARAAALMDGLIDAVVGPPGPADIELVPDGVATDSIWTYERAPGRRVVFPWRADGLPGGAVQVDVVFGETLAEPAQRTAVPAADLGCVALRAAGPAQSLAWKLLWLAADTYPQGKDLYDAVLLAERFALPMPVLEQTLRLGEADPPPATASAFVGGWDVDWGNFLAEYPAVGGDAASWLSRLAAALAPTFGEAGGAAAGGAAGPDDGRAPPPGPAALDPNWLRWNAGTVPTVARYIGEQGAYHDLPVLGDALEEAGCTYEEAIAHCRANGPHSRGCWVVDLILNGP